MKNLIIGVAAAVTLVILLAAGQDGADENARLRKEVADLGLRVAQLEHAGGVTHEGSDTAAKSDHPHTMVVGGISMEAGKVDNQDEIDRLQSEVDSLQDTVDYHKDNQARALGDFGGTAYRDHGSWHSDYRQRDREMVSQEQMANRYGAQLATKKRKIERLQQQQNLPHQMIHGHRGDVVITLHTKYSLATDLEGIEVGDVVSWAGTRISADETSESWEITTIEKLDS